MKKTLLLLGIVALVAAGIFGYRYWQQQHAVNDDDTLDPLRQCRYPQG